MKEDAFFNIQNTSYIIYLSFIKKLKSSDIIIFNISSQNLFLTFTLNIKIKHKTF